MTKQEQQWIRETFAQAERLSQIFALTFYQRLFHLDPTLRAMFRSDIVGQSRKLMESLRTLVDNVEQMKDVTATLKSLGRRHAGYGVRDEHYHTVGSALLWTFGHVLGDGFSPEANEAWVKLYSRVAAIMKRAAAFEDVSKAPPAYNDACEGIG